MPPTRSATTSRRTASGGCWWSPTRASRRPGTRSGSPSRSTASASRRWSSTARTSSRPTRACVEAVEFARDAGPWDAFVAVGGGSAIDTAKAVNLLTTNPGELIDYVNAPVGQGRRRRTPLEPLVAVPTTDRHRQREHHRLRARRARAAGQDRDQPPAAAADPGGGRPRLTMTQPAGVTAASGMDILCHALESWTARPVRHLRPEDARAAGAVLRRQPDRATCGRRRRCACSQRRSAPPCTTATTSRARPHGAGRDVRRHGLRQRRRAHPARQRLPDRRPGPGLPPGGLPRRRADGAARHVGVADRARGVPVHLRRGPGAAPARGRAARPRQPTGPATGATPCRR